MEKETHSFPTEEVILPSKGILYSKDSPLSKGDIEIKYMTAKEEDILTNQNYINNATVIDKLLQSLIVTPINYDDLLIGDKNAILVAARILGYGSEYNFKYKDQEVSIDLTDIKDKEFDESLMINKNVNEFEWKGQQVSIDLTKLKEQEINKDLAEEGKNEFFYTLPISKKQLTFKILNHGDDQKINKELEGLKKMNKNAASNITTRLKHQITSIDGNREQKDIRSFIDNEFLAQDARSFRKHVKSIGGDIDLNVDIEMPDGTHEESVSLPIGISFFWPDAEI